MCKAAGRLSRVRISTSPSPGAGHRHASRPEPCRKPASYDSILASRSRRRWISSRRRRALRGCMLIVKWLLTRDARNELIVALEIPYKRYENTMLLLCFCRCQIYKPNLNGKIVGFGGFDTNQHLIFPSFEAESKMKEFHMNSQHKMCVDPSIIVIKW